MCYGYVFALCAYACACKQYRVWVLCIFAYVYTNVYVYVCLGVSMITNERVGERLCVFVRARGEMYTVCCNLHCQFVQPKIRMLSGAEKASLCVTVIVPLCLLLLSWKHTHRHTQMIWQKTTACHPTKCTKRNINILRDLELQHGRRGNMDFQTYVLQKLKMTRYRFIFFPSPEC